MRKFVKYKGKTTEFLMRGKTYEIESFDFKTNEYTLKNVKGKYPSVLFEEIERFLQQKPTYIAFGREMPELGQELFVVRINKGKIEPIRISAIKDISYIGGELYRIETVNSVYMTEITE